jgi:PD-(D/E)XK nuclease superfamily
MTTLPSRRPPTLLPSYSLTGDLLNYVRCPYQYRSFTRPGVRESHPVQRWYGQFLHRGMRRAYDLWKNSSLDLTTLTWNDPPAQSPPYSDLTNEVTLSLRAEGLYRPGRMGSVAEKRLLRAIRLLGPLLFPVIKQAEVRLNAIRQFQQLVYQVTGVVDVLAAADFQSQRNALVDLLSEKLPDLTVSEDRDTEIIVDYKGVAKDEVQGQLDPARNQVLTYAWLRNRRLGAQMVVAGILVFVNDLLEDNEDPNVDPDPVRARQLIEEAVEIVPVVPTTLDAALLFFDNTVFAMEEAAAREGTAPLDVLWPPHADKKTCAACDARWHCPDSLVAGSPNHRPFAPNAP